MRDSKGQATNQLDDFIQQEKAKIVSETAKINWKELETFFAQGKLILVDGSLDLIDVAFAVSTDDAKKVSVWMESELVSRDFTQKAIAFEKDNREVWSVVIKPWILIQELKH